MKALEVIMPDGFDFQPDGSKKHYRNEFGQIRTTDHNYQVHRSNMQTKKEAIELANSLQNFDVAFREAKKKNQK